MRQRIVPTLLALMSVLPALRAGAQPAAPAPAADLSGVARLAADEATSPKPLWELGVFGFGVSQTAYPGAAERTRRAFGLPFAIYRGRYLRVDESTVGVRALHTPRAELDIGFSGSFGASSTDVEIRRGMPSLGTLFEFGPRLRLSLPAPLPGSRLRLALPLRAVFDVSDSFQGRGFAFEPELDFSLRLAGGTRIGARLGAILGDRKLNDYVYGVAPQFATTGRPAYDGQAGLIATRLSLTTATSLGKDWDLFSFARYDNVSGAANGASPLVRKSGGPSVGIGLAWTFWRSERLEPN